MSHREQAAILLSVNNWCSLPYCDCRAWIHARELMEWTKDTYGGVTTSRIRRDIAVSLLLSEAEGGE